MNSKALILSKALFALNGIISIFIGLAHTYAHYTELVTSEINGWLDKDIIVTGVKSNIWHLWQGMSLMMGILLIIIGLISLAVIFNLNKDDFPPVNISIIIILMLIAVIYSGVNFFGSAQVYGGIFGIVVQTASIVASKLKK